MHVHPDLAALQSDPASQRRIEARMKAALADWRSGEQSKVLGREIAHYGAGIELAACPALDALFTDQQGAYLFAADWISTILHVLRGEPLAEVARDYRWSQGLSSMQLLRSGNAALSLVAYERRPTDDALHPETVMFVDSQSHELVLAGSASGTFHRRNSMGAKIRTTAKRWTVGDQIVLTGPQTARQIVQVDGAMLVLRLTRAPERPCPASEYRLSDGTLLQSASGDKGASQRLMALAVLGAMDHAPALEVMAGRALDLDEDLDVRWEGVRQLLAMNTARGLAVLHSLGNDARDPLHKPASDLARDLLASQPALSGLMTEFV